MSDIENKDQQTQEPQGEPQQVLFAGKFKSAEELEKSYLHLQQKLGDRRPATPAAPQQSAPDKEEYEWKQKNQQLDAKQAIIDARKKEASDALSDGDNLDAVRRALGDRDAIAQFEQEFDAGHVSASEVKRLAKMGGNTKENPKTIPEQEPTHTGQASEAEVAYMMKHLKSSQSPYFNQFSPDHKAVVTKVNEIKQKVGM